MAIARRAGGVDDDDHGQPMRRAAMDDTDQPTTTQPVVPEPPGDPARVRVSEDQLEHPAGARPARQRGRHFGTSVLWTVLGTVLPGAGLLPTRARALGGAILSFTLLGVAGLAWGASQHLGLLAGVSVRPHWLFALGVALATIAVLWVGLITAGHLATRPRPATPLQRAAGGALVGLLCFVVSAPLLVVANYARAQAGLVNDVFHVGGTRRSQTRPELQDNTFANKPRLNVLLLGGDSNAARNKKDPTAGIRTDTTMLLSVDTSNGNAVLIQLPRNMAAFTFPQGSPLAAAYPNGYWSGVEGDRENPEYELNSVWKNVPEKHPELFQQTDYPNADATKYAVEGITGLKPDYFVLLNIDGIQKLIDAMGGIRVNVNTRIPMAQTAEEAAAGIPPKSGYLEPGPDKLLTGYEAMWYARSRSQSKDPDRMARQGCVVKAIVDQANPQTLMTRYESIATASKDALLTDIPQEIAPALMRLLVQMRDGQLTRVLFAYPNTKYLDGTGFEPWRPDAAKVQALVQRGIDASEGVLPSPSATPSSRPSTASPSPRPVPSRTSSASASASPSSAAQDPNANLKDACAYHPTQG